MKIITSRFPLLLKPTKIVISRLQLMMKTTHIFKRRLQNLSKPPFVFYNSILLYFIQKSQSHTQRYDSDHFI